jgi:hypothetical protein
MSAGQIKALRTLVKVRQRQGQRLEEALAGARRALAERDAEVEAATGELADRVAAEEAAIARRARLVDTAFTTDALRTFELLLDDACEQRTQAERGLAQRHQAAQRQAAAVAAAQVELRRNQERIERFEAQVETLLRKRDAAVEEAAEEETEEGAAARFVKRQRAAREAGFDE